jgi:hypothetical protein
VKAVSLERGFGLPNIPSRNDESVMHNELNEIRNLKNELVGMIRARVAALGPDSLPAGFDEGWVDVWESGSSRSENLPADNPWESFRYIARGGVGVTTYIFEAASPNPIPYPFP